MTNNKIGALWAKTSKKGEDYFTGELIINEQKILIAGFYRKKKSDKEPTIDLVESKPTGLKVTPTDAKVELL